MKKACRDSTTKTITRLISGSSTTTSRDRRVRSRLSWRLLLDTLNTRRVVEDMCGRTRLMKTGDRHKMLLKIWMRRGVMQGETICLLVRLAVTNTRSNHLKAEAPALSMTCVVTILI